MGIQRYKSDDFAGALSCFARAMEIDLEQASGAKLHGGVQGHVGHGDVCDLLFPEPLILSQVGSQHQVMTMYLNNIARVHESQGRWDRAAEFHLRVIELAIEAGGAHSLEVSVALEDIAYCHVEMGLGRDMSRDQAVIRNSLKYLLRAFDISFSL